MTDSVSIARPQSLRQRGFNEAWLEALIVANPAALGLGELEVVSRQRRQSSGGRLDLLLKDPEDDSMYEVELMLGETEESHIIRTLEYWDVEKRKWPLRQHYAVLVAETITRRFFNVIQLLSHAAPIIAIQATLIEANGGLALHFVKVLDTYEEPEEEGAASSETYDESYWRSRSASTLETAKSLCALLLPVVGACELKYLKHYIAIAVNQSNYFWIHKRTGNKSLFSTWLPNDLLARASEQLDEAAIPYAKRKDEIRMTIDQRTVEQKPELFRSIGVLVKDAWEG